MTKPMLFRRSDGWWLLRDYLNELKPFKNYPKTFRGVMEKEGIGCLPPFWSDSFKNSNVAFVIYSYDTPIAWAQVNNKGMMWIHPQIKYSQTTSMHQNKVFTAISQLPNAASLLDNFSFFDN